MRRRRRCVDMRCDGVMVLVHNVVQAVAESRKRMRIMRYHCLRCGLIINHAIPVE